MSIGLGLINSVYFQLIKPQSHQIQQAPSTPFSATSIVSDSGVFLSNFFADDDFTADTQSQSQQCSRFILEKALDGEILHFTELISNKQLIASCKNSSSFWIKNSKKLPKLSELFIIINSVPASTAGIERYFNITGLINNDRRLRMMDDLVEMRSLFKANLPILDELTTISESINKE